MTKQDTEKLFLLLRQFYRNRQTTSEMLLAYQLALEPYSYDAVRDAALQCARECKFFPDVSELVSRIPQIAQEERKKDNAWMAPYIDELTEQDFSRSVSKEARRRGITWRDCAGG